MASDQRTPTTQAGLCLLDARAMPPPLSVLEKTSDNLVKNHDKALKELLAAGPYGKPYGVPEANDLVYTTTKKAEMYDHPDWKRPTGAFSFEWEPGVQGTLPDAPTPYQIPPVTPEINIFDKGNYSENQAKYYRPSKRFYGYAKNCGEEIRARMVKANIPFFYEGIPEDLWESTQNRAWRTCYQKLRSERSNSETPANRSTRTPSSASSHSWKPRERELTTCDLQRTSSAPALPNNNPYNSLQRNAHIVEDPDSKFSGLGNKSKSSSSSATKLIGRKRAEFVQWHKTQAAAGAELRKLQIMKAKELQQKRAATRRAKTDGNSPKASSSPVKYAKKIENNLSCETIRNQEELLQRERRSNMEKANNMLNAEMGAGLGWDATEKDYANAVMRSLGRLIRQRV